MAQIRRLASLVISFGVVGMLAARVGAAADWPTWRGDGTRSGATAERLSTELTLHWQMQLPTPRPAWPDEQGKVRFDASYEPVVADGRLFVPSNADDSIAAYRLSDGGLIWRFFTDGPVRFAPVVHRDRVLCVSDDGYLYCLTAQQGALLWKRRGGPQNRKILGNDRLISMWPARGAPVVYGDTVYWAAGIWPFMGVFVQAVDIESGQPVWTNSGSGSNYLVQQHTSPAFAGIAPQGYLTVNDKTLLVSGGMTVPAAFDRQTGALLYYRPGDRELGKDLGGYDVLLGPDWFANHGRLHRLSDGEPLLQVPVDIVTPQCVYGIAGKHLVASQLTIERYVETTVDTKGKEKHTVKRRLPELWRAPLPDGLTTIQAKAGEQFIATDGGARVALVSVAPGDAPACHVDWETVAGDTAWRAIVADGRLLVVGLHGLIACYGARSDGPASPLDVRDAPAVPAPLSPAESATPAVTELLTHVAARSGYAVVDQAVDEQSLTALAHATQFQIIALCDDEHQRQLLRTGLRSAGLLGSRIAVVPGNMESAELPPYMAELLVTATTRATAAAAESYLNACARVLRPYGGTAVWACPTEHAAELSAALAQSAPDVQLEVSAAGLLMRRPGALPGAGSWTHQNADAANTLVSPESRLKLPLGLLWFGGPSNREVLPRHGHGPIPQVIGGRLFIEGRDTIRAVDVYTGRLLWQREFKDVGIFYDNTDHHPGANAIGGNFVCTADSLYLTWGRRCLRLDAASGQTLAEFTLPPDESGEQPFWGYIAVHGDFLIAGSSPMLLLARAPGEKLDADDPEQLKRQVPLFAQFGEGSHRLLVMNRHNGQVLWTRDAQFSFRHNAIAVGGGNLFCLDRMTEQQLAHFRRRGEVPVADFSLFALDLATGSLLWQSTEQAFGTWLAYSESTGLLLEAGSKNRDRSIDEVGKGLAVFEGATGTLLWRNDDDYGGPPLLYPDTIVTQGTAYDLRTGAVKNRTHPLTGEPLRWKFARNYGCNTAIGCLSMLTFRSAAAGYFDLANDGGTGNWGGFRSSCTSNLVAADGVLNAPDYTRTCTCSYQNQCSLALVPMPDAEMWTFNPIPSSGKRVQRLGINFGAPGDRKAEDGTLWLDFPSVGGPSPDVPVTLTGQQLEYVREHASLVPGTQLPWVFASGVRGVRHVRVRLASAEEAAAGSTTYEVRVYWRDATATDLQGPDAAVRCQGRPAAENGRLLDDPGVAGNCFIQQFSGVVVGEFLDLDIAAGASQTASGSRRLLCGIEVLAR
jgi:outer membrane protein assembly factor BamB